jgi:class 3 adenylate cyclase/tetratricopeptide (TPR) repeat protein
VICPSCASENDPGAKFCNECGTPLAAPCPTCGATNKPGAKFCNECGTQLGAVTAPPSAAAATGTAAPVAERRLVTVLFADIVGFTPFAEERDAEEVRETLSRYFELCAELIDRYGGTVEKYIGDAVMAVWGAPTAHEDDAERAVRAALELVAAVPGLAQGVQARAGVMTGEAAVTLGATNQGIVAGDLVNTASRVQSVAPAGAVLVGESTMRASSTAIAYEPAGDQALKGKQAPVAAWLARRVVAERGGRNRSTGLEAPFVGRADELRLLKDLFHATGREQKVRLVSVIGPAGIGKSRLAWEFLKYVDGLVETTYWHDGRSPAYGEGISFWALGEMIRGRCGLVETDDEATTRQKVTETVAQWVPIADEQAWIERALLTLLGIETGLSSDELFAAWRTFFERISEQGTVTLVFEDLHFADTGLIDFIEHMLDWSRGRPIYIVTLSRPELLDRRPDWGAGKRAFNSIYLEPLSGQQMRELLAGLVPGLPESAATAIIGRADGVPLYAVETVRMLVADGRLIERDGRYEPVGDLTQLAVPETLTALIRSRLDGLDKADAALLSDAAVLGQSFSVAAVAAMAGVDASATETRLRALARRELVEQQADPRSPERGQYAFVQALIREVAYNTLSKKDRKARHLAAARYFEQIGSDELAGALASHYVAAHANASDAAEADALGAQARVTLRAAADRAERLGAHDQAVAFLRQALSVTSDPSEKADLLERAANNASVAANSAAAVQLARDAVALRESLDDRVAAARASASYGWILLNARRDGDAREALEHALERYEDLWPDPQVGFIKLHLARALGQFDEHERAVQLCDEVLEIAEHANLPRLLAQGLIGKGVNQAARGRLREGVALIGAGEQVAHENGLTEMVLAGLVVRGYTLGEIDNAQAMRCYREGFEIARRTGRTAQLHHFINNIGYSGFLTGEWSEALTIMDEGLEGDLDDATRLWLLSNALVIRAARGDEASAAFAELNSLASKFSDPQISSAPLDPIANKAQAEGRLEEAQAAFIRMGDMHATQLPAAAYQAARSAHWRGDVDAVRGLLARIDATGYQAPVVEARRTSLRADIAALEGNTGEALRLYLEAIRAWHDLQVVWEEALTGLDMVVALDPAKPEVAAVASATRQIFERLEARPYLERLDAALARSGGTRPQQDVVAPKGAGTIVGTGSPH